MATRGGNKPSSWRLYKAGSSLRCARSPPPPKMTKVTGSAAAAEGSPADNCSTIEETGVDVSDIALLHGVPAKLIAHRSEHAFGEWVALTRSEAREQGGRQRRQRHAALDPFLERPPPLAGVSDVPFELRQIVILGE